LIVDADLETGGTPIHELNTPLCLDVGNRRVDVFGDHVTPVQHTAGHVFAVTWVAFDHLVNWVETGVGDLRDGELLMVGLLG
jgi:hypothetical protein